MENKEKIRPKLFIDEEFEH